MSGDPEHVVRIALREPVPSEIPVGSSVDVSVRVSCAAGCKLAGMSLAVIAPDGSQAVARLDGDTGKLTLTAPAEVGQHRWHIATAAHETGDVVHAAATLDIALATRPHHTSLAVWAIPDAAVAGTPFTIKAGVKCVDGCALRGQRIDIVDAGGTVLASGQAGDAPWAGTSALYWTELTLPAPSREGLATLAASTEATSQGLAHDGASSSFTVAVAKPPEHTLTVKVIAKDTADPIADADIRLGAYRATTGPSGLAEVRIGAGTYEMHVWKAGYEAPITALDISADTSVQVEAVAMPEEDPDARWKM
jgi:hypothetical protein